MSAQHPPLHPGPVAADRYLSLRLPAPGPATWATDGGEVVLARVDEEPRPHALVVVRGGDTAPSAAAGGDGADRLEVRKVGRVTPESVELIPLDGGVTPRVVPRAGDAVVGTVLLRWRAG